MTRSRCPRLTAVGRASVWVLLAALTAGGCASPARVGAWRDFRSGNLDRAEASLRRDGFTEKNALLFYLERALIRQANGKYAESAEDFLAAADRLEQLEVYSLSRGAGSLLIQEEVQAYRGLPYEWALLHAFAAKNYLAQGLWDGAAVEARRVLIVSDENRRGPYPDNAYSRYLAGLCLELTGDPSNAALQYRHAGALLAGSGRAVDDRTGRIVPEEPPPPGGTHPEAACASEDRDEAQAVSAPLPPGAVEPWPREESGPELVFFVLLGHVPLGNSMRDTSWRAARPLHAELYHQGVRLGRSYELADVGELALASEQQRALKRAAKTATRFVFKEALAHAVAENNQVLGDLLRLLLFAVEQPDLRQWSTLPRWLHVARVPCSPDLQSFEARIVTPNGHVVRTLEIDGPLVRRNNLCVSFFRDLPPPSRLWHEDGKEKEGE